MNNSAAAYHSPMAEAEATARRSLTAWGIEQGAGLSLLKMRENAVFAVRAPNGKRYALRLHRPGYHSDRALTSELQWMMALQAQGFPVPAVVKTSIGENFVRVRASVDALEYQCDLLDWISGSPIGQSESRESLALVDVTPTYHILGRLAAELHLLSARWNRPRDFCRHSWDEKGCLGKAALWGDYTELHLLGSADLATLQAASALVLERLEAYGKGPTRYGLIHADLVPENVLRDNERLVVLDFDDAGFGWYLWELVTAVFFLQETPAYAPALKAMIGGYREIRELSDEDLAVLPELMLLRGLVYLGWFQTRRETETAKQMAAPIARLTLDLAATLLANREPSPEKRESGRPHQ